MLNYKGFTTKINESAPAIPTSVDYWKSKGKDGKQVMLYFHNDLDGVFSAIVTQNWLKNKGFDIVGYGLVEYQEGWKKTTLNPKYINIALDYAEDVPGIDCYMDHHGNFIEGDFRGSKSIKTATGSAFEGICRQLGVPTDSLTLDVIDMVDSAKYDEYKVDIKDVLNFNYDTFKNSKTPKLTFAGAFNQLLKRSDYKTFIEVVANATTGPSIYNIFRLFKIFYPKNNPIVSRSHGIKSIRGYKDLLSDASDRLDRMERQTIGSGQKTYISSQKEFKEMWSEPVINKKTGVEGIKIKPSGYQILGQLVFVPTGTWANPIRARAIVEKAITENDLPDVTYNVVGPLAEQVSSMNKKHVELIGDIEKLNATQANLTVKKIIGPDDDLEGIKGYVEVVGNNIKFHAKQPLFWIMLQYGGSLQVCSFHKLDKYAKEYLPVLKDGTRVEDLGEYTEKLLNIFKMELWYNNQNTKAGGHPGIGNISDIGGTYEGTIFKNLQGVKFIDLFKNKMIQDLSLIPWPDLGMIWNEAPESSKTKETNMDHRVLMLDDIRKLNKNSRLSKEDTEGYDISAQQEELNK